MENSIFIISLLLIGIGLRYLPDMPKNAAQALTTFVIYVSLPALILLRVPQLKISADILIPAFMPWLMLLTSAALVLLLARVFRWSRPVTGVLMLLAPLGNTSFLGIPLVESYFGPENVPYALIYDQLGTFLILATYGSVIIAVYADVERTSGKAILKKVLTFPPLIALAVASIFIFLPYPPVVTTFLEPLAATLIPLVIVAVGLKIEFQVERTHLQPMAVALGIKLLIAPALALAVILLAGWDGAAARVSVFEAGMPAQISAWALAMSAGLAPKLGAMIVAVGIVLSFGTLALVFELL